MKKITVLFIITALTASLFSCAGGYRRFLKDFKNAAEAGDLKALIALTDPEIVSGAVEQCKTTDDLTVLLPFYDGLVSTPSRHITVELKYKSKTESPDGSVFVFCDAYIGVSGVAGKQYRYICIETVDRGGKTYIRDIV